MSSDNDDARSVLATLSYYAGRSLPSHLIDVARQYGLATGGWLYPRISPPIAAGSARPGQDMVAFGQSLRERAHDAGITLLTRADPAWPAVTIGGQLPCLWVSGASDLAGLRGKAVTITGARACTAYGTFMGSQLTHDLTAEACTVVTGASAGINARAAIAALTGDKPALILVNPAGLDHHYTSTTIRGLVTQAAQHATVISAFPPGRTPSHASWELTNRLLGTIGAATVIVEAHPNSPALRCAHAAAEARRPVCAVPGPVTSGVSAGCHRLIIDGIAQLVTGAGDILTAIGSPPLSHGNSELSSRPVRAAQAAGWHP